MNFNKKRKRIKKADWRHHLYQEESEAQMAGGYRLSVHPVDMDGRMVEKGQEPDQYVWFLQGPDMGSRHGVWTRFEGSGPSVREVYGVSKNSSTAGFEKSRIAAMRKALAAYKKFIQNQHPEW